MTAGKIKYVVQRTKHAGNWIDILESSGAAYAEDEFRRWANLKSKLFFVRLIKREVVETEVLLSHVFTDEDL